MEEVVNIPPAPEKIKSKKKSRLKKIIKWFFISIFSTIFLLVATAFIIVYFFEDDIKKYAVEQINKEINTKIEVEDIKLSFFKKFPMASLEFVNVKCIEVSDKEQKENLLEAKSVFLEFRIWDIFRGNYQFKKLSVENGSLDLEIDKSGKTNFDIFKKPAPGEPRKKKEMSFKFNEFIFKNVHVSYNDKRSKQEYRVQVKKLNCSGNFTDHNFTLKAKGNIFSEVVSLNEEDFMSNKNLYLNITLELNNDKKICSVKNANIELEDMKIQLNGNFNYGSTPYVDIAFNGENLNIQSFLSILPSSYKTFEKKYKSQGDFYLRGSVKGSIADDAIPHIIAEFGINKGKIKFVEEGIEMKEIFLKGNFNTGNENSPQSAELNLQHFEGKLENSSVSGDFYLKNLHHPSLKFTVNADVDLAEVFKFIPVEKIESISGRVQTNLAYEGKLGSNTFTFKDYTESVSNGKAVLNNVTLKIKDKPLNLSNCTGEVVFENNVGRIPNLTGKIASTEFALKGEAFNLPEYFYLDGYPLIIDAEINCGKIMVEEFMVTAQTQKTNNKNDLGLNIPANIDLKLKASVNELSFKKFTAQKIKGSITIKNRKLYADDLNFESCGGTANITGSVNTTDPDNITTQAFGSFQQINISMLFGQFENFGQKTLEDKHLKGTANANIAYAATFDRDLKMRMNTLFVNSPMTIENGELIDFKPLEGLSKFIHVEELRHIRFSTLTNTIEIKDESVIIPKMVIQSSALNLEIGGIHYFDNRIDYYFNVFLKDILAAKWKKRKKEDEFGELIEEEGGARIYLRMTGTMDNYKITVDKKGVKEKFKEDMKKEGQDFKQIFYEEFGAFKNDSTVKKNTLQLPKQEKKNKVKSNDDFEFE
jgi:hypothetical protein